MIAAPYMWLVYSLVLFYVMIGWQVLQGMRAHGIASAFGPRDGWSDSGHVAAGRANRAVRNMAEALILFAPLVIISVQSGAATQLTTTAAILFFVSRLLYAPTYWLGVPYLRTLFWFGGVIAIFMVVFEVLF